MSKIAPQTENAPAGTALPPIEIFRPGTFTATNGEAVTYSEADLIAIAASYDPALYQSPVVVGHPDMDAPAYGMVSGLSMHGDRLVAETEAVPHDFAELVRTKRYRTVSASFWPKGHAASPRPEGAYLKHLGFLGAAAPAVKGLRPVAFSEAQKAGCLTFETPNPQQEAMMADDKKKDDQVQNFAEREAALVTREAALANKEAKLTTRETEIATAATAARKADALSFAESQIAAGKLAPAGKDKIVFLIETLAAPRDTILSFGEGEKAQSPVALFKQLFDTAGPIVSFGESAKAEGRADVGDDDPAKIAASALSFAEDERKAGRTISVAAAVRHVMQPAKG